MGCNIKPKKPLQKGIFPSLAMLGIFGFKVSKKVKDKQHFLFIEGIRER
jgi:hypothetical protein